MDDAFVMPPPQRGRLPQRQSLSPDLELHSPRAPRPLSSQKLTTKDVIKTYSLDKLYRHYGEEGLMSFDCSNYIEQRLNPLFFTLEEIEEANMRNPENQSKMLETQEVVRWNLCPRDARNLYVERMNCSFFTQHDMWMEPTNKNYTWASVAMAICVTAKLVEDAFQGEKDARMFQLMEWCSLFFRSYRVDDWIESHGGWEQLAVDYEEERRQRNELRSQRRAQARARQRQQEWERLPPAWRAARRSPSQPQQPAGHETSKGEDRRKSKEPQQERKESSSKREETESRRQSKHESSLPPKRDDESSPPHKRDDEEDQDSSSSSSD